ncbi:MAG TPA: hypothetical protein VMD76_01790 [Candidatus Sulfotelmatobacter sp.]|nr:hypothetical protein [Candidatus Sulfotelmatobacter sp.]
MSKPAIQPAFVVVSAVSASFLFRYLWNNPPAFAQESRWLVVATAIAAFFALTFGLAWLMTLCFGRWVKKP